ncbi:MAG: class I SAM-dependent methyltransferase [Kofleriaceae bacterium]
MSETLQHYDRWSASYDAHDNPMVAATAWAMAQSPLGCDGADVVELGCGTGRNVAHVLAAGARTYVGVDGSPGMLAVARARQLDRVRFVEADLGTRGPLDDASFDFALIVLVLEHVRELDAIFGEAARLLRPGGRLRILEIHPALIASGTVAHFRDEAGEVRFDSSAHPVPTLTAALARAGLTEVTVRELAATGALLERVPKLAKHHGRLVLVDLEARRG